MKITIATNVTEDGKSTARQIDGAEVFGSWAAHPGLNWWGYRVTYLPLGLACPFVFHTMEAAKAVAKEVNSLRESWEDLPHEEIKPRYAEKIKAICRAHAGEESYGPVGDYSPLPAVAGA